MDWITEPSEPPDADSVSPDLQAAPRPDAFENESEEGTGAPLLDLDGFHGPLDQLLTLARAAKVDLAALSLTALVEQLAAALRQATVPLGQKGDWVVMAAWLLQLRTRLLLPAAEAQQAAEAETEQLRQNLLALQAAQALAAWLEQQPQLGRDSFVRGRPEVFGVSLDAVPALDVVEFLWASLGLFDDGTGDPDTVGVYRSARADLHTVAEAQDRILQRLAEAPHGTTLDQLLPAPPDRSEDEERQALRWRSAWASTFSASLELAKQGAVRLGQEKEFQIIHVTCAYTSGKPNVVA
jgi:segregation and condensation protein A